MAGTAPVAPRWACLEHRGAWPRDITRHTDPAIVGFAARAAAAGFRLQLIRRPGRRRRRRRGCGSTSPTPPRQGPTPRWSPWQARPNCSTSRCPRRAPGCPGRPVARPAAAGVHARPPRPLLRARRARPRQGPRRRGRARRLGVQPPQRPPVRPDGAGPAHRLPVRPPRRRHRRPRAEGRRARRGRDRAVPRPSGVLRRRAGRRSRRAHSHRHPVRRCAHGHRHHGARPPRRRGLAGGRARAGQRRRIPASCGAAALPVASLEAVAVTPIAARRACSTPASRDAG